MTAVARTMLALLLLVSDGGITVRRREIPADVAARRAALHEGRPALRGFWPADPSTWTEPTGADGAARKTADLVRKKLARDGLVATTAAAKELLGTSDNSRLAAVGIPVDLLPEFDAVTGALEFRQSAPGFRASSESGEEAIVLARVQIASDRYFAGEGDGGSVDVVRQLLESLPDVEFVASIEEKHLEGFLDLAKAWPERMTVVPEPLPVSQWAQDNGKPGLVDGRPCLLVPRYASRGEDGASFVPGETFLVENLVEKDGLHVVHSPLLFQGGDLLVARDPSTGGRVLFIGEANVWRNTALGLSKEQVLEAFRIEMGVDRCVMLPAVSFHIDQEVTFRTVGSRTIAFVADAVAAVRIVLRCGVEALERAGVLRASDALRELDEGKDAEFLGRVVPAVASRCAGFGRFPESLAAWFSTGPADSGVGNLQRFLLATDLLSSWTMAASPPAGLDPHSLAYLRSFQRRDAERRELAAALEGLGYEVVKIPSLPEEKRGIDYLNGVHDRGRYLMPAWGGLFSPLDEAARAAFAKALGPETKVLPILTSESQRRGGGVHCSLSVCTRP